MSRIDSIKREWELATSVPPQETDLYELQRLFMQMTHIAEKRELEEIISQARRNKIKQSEKPDEIMRVGTLLGSIPMVTEDELMREVLLKVRGEYYRVAEVRRERRDTLARPDCKEKSFDSIILVGKFPH